MQRLTLVKNHLSNPLNPKDSLAYYRSSSTVNAIEVREAFFGKHYEFRDRFYKIFGSDPVFKQQYALEADRKDTRRNALHQMKKILETFPLTYEDYLKDPFLLLSYTSSMNDLDQGLGGKFGVHLSLYLKTIINLGTFKHRGYIEDGFKYKDIGCFALTELAHGSNTRGILTRADYDHKTREFVITTPKDIAMKIWIGAAAHLANMCVVWAQLYIDDKGYGIHAFVVPIRNKRDHSLMPGVIIGDCGLKVGLNNIDNGMIMFTDVRVPYDSLLDRFSSIDENGQFQSPIKKADKRFGISLGSLSGGRIAVTDSSLVNLRLALTIAIRFACARRQFGPPNQPEIPLIEYPLTQYRLIPILAWHFAYGYSNYSIADVWYQNQDSLFDEKNPLLAELHALSSANKAFFTWGSQRGVQQCREICGGLGYSAYNRLGTIREDNDIHATWEGDNNILLQQTAKFLMDNLQALKNGDKIPHKSLEFLTAEFDPDSFKPVDGKSPFAQSSYNIKKASEFRANYLIHTAFMQTLKAMQDGTPFEAWNHTQAFYWKEASRAYGEVYMIEQAMFRVKKCREPNTKKVLRKLNEVFGWSLVEQTIGSYMEFGYMDKKDIEYTREKILSCCGELKGEVLGVVDAISPPDHVLNSPIGSYDGDIYKRFLSAVWSAPGTFEKPSYWREIHTE